VHIIEKHARHCIVYFALYFECMNAVTNYNTPDSQNLLFPDCCSLYIKPVLLLLMDIKPIFRQLRNIYIFTYLLVNTHFHKNIKKHYKTVCIDNKMSRPMTALTDINLRAYTNIKHKT